MQNVNCDSILKTQHLALTLIQINPKAWSKGKTITCSFARPMLTELQNWFRVKSNQPNQ